MTKNQNINFFGQIMLQLDDFSQKTRSKLEFCLKNAKLQLWWLLLIFGFYPCSFEGSYLSHGWEKIFSAGLIQKSMKKSFRSLWILSNFLQKWRYSDISKYSKNRFFQVFDQSHFAKRLFLRKWR